MKVFYDTDDQLVSTTNNVLEVITNLVSMLTSSPIIRTDAYYINSS